MVTVNNELETFFNEYEVAKLVHLSVATVRRWRLMSQGPRYLKIGAAVRYRPADVIAWLETRPSGGGQNPAEAAR